MTSQYFCYHGNVKNEHNLLFLILKSNSFLLRLKGIAHIHLAEERYNVFKCCFYIWYILVAMVT